MFKGCSAKESGRIPHPPEGGTGSAHPMREWIRGKNVNRGGLGEDLRNSSLSGKTRFYDPNLPKSGTKEFLKLYFFYFFIWQVFLRFAVWQLSRQQRD